MNQVIAFGRLQSFVIRGKKFSGIKVALAATHISQIFSLLQKKNKHNLLDSVLLEAGNIQRRIYVLCHDPSKEYFAHERINWIAF